LLTRILTAIADEGITILCVTHEMGFAKTVTDRVIFMDQGQIVEQNNPHDFFNKPQSDRSKDFLSKILGHCVSSENFDYLFISGIINIVCHLYLTSHEHNT